MKKITHNQFVVVHNHIDALQEELGNANWELSKQLNECENVNDDLCNKLTMGFQDIDTKLSELLIDDMFIKDLQQNVESTQKNLNEFKNVYTSFRESSFITLFGNVDTNNICLNELSKGVMCVQENVWSITQKVHKMGQTMSSFEKSLDFVKSKELTLLQKDFISFRSKVSDFIDLCWQAGCFESLRNRTDDETEVGMSCHSYDNVESELGELQNLLM